MEQLPSASSVNTNPTASLTAVSSSTTPSAVSCSDLLTGSFSSLPDSQSFISLEELIDCDDSSLLSSFTASSDSATTSLLKALKPNSSPFPFSAFPSPSHGTDKSCSADGKSSPFAQLQLFVKPPSERRAASVLLPAAAPSSSSASAPASSASPFDSSLVPSVGEASAAAARSTARAHSVVTPVSSVSLLPRKRPANRSPPLRSVPSPFSFPPSFVPSPLVQPTSQPPSETAVPSWSTHSSDALAHLASHHFDQAVYSYLLGIRAAPSHPHCRQQLLALLLSQLRLHPTAAPSKVAARMSGNRRMTGSIDLDREVSLIESLDNEDDMLSGGSSSESEQANDLDDDEDMGIVCRPNAAERERMLRQYDEQRLYTEQPHHDEQQHQQQQQQHMHEGGKVKPHAPQLDDDQPNKPAAHTSSDDTEADSTKDEQPEHDKDTTHGPQSLKLRMLHSYPRSLASILPHSTTATTQPSADNDEDEDDEEIIENKEDYEIRLAAISYLSPDIACGLCGLFLYRPVTAMCGHSFCQLCLTTFLDRQPISSLASLPCPYPKCNEPLASSRAVCVQLASTLEKCFPCESAVAKMHSEAISAISAGKDEDAITFLTSALVQWPDTFPLYSARLCCYLRMCQFDMAMADLKHCIELTQPTAAKQLATVSSQPQTSKPLSLTLPPFHQRSAAVQSLTALGQAGLLTRFYRLAVYSFATALRLSGADESTIVDREKMAQGLIDAYLANVNAVLADMHPAPPAAATEEKQSEKRNGSVRHISSRSLMPSRPTSSSSSASSASSATANGKASHGSGWFANAMSSFSSSSSSSSTPSSSSSTLSASSSKSTSPSSQSLSPSLTSFYLPMAGTSPSTSTTHFSPLPAHPRRRQEPYRLMVDHPTPSVVSSECVCLVCMELLYEPVTTVCGHTFCRLCLARSLDHKNLCPFCRVSLSVHISPTRQHVNVAIKALLQRWCEGRYERRHARITAALQEQASYLPLFVCTLMFPGVRCPLHIFEPRYRLMIRSVLESGYNRFGMVIHADAEGGFGSIGCSAEIRNVRLLSDGRSLVDTVGGQRFRILEGGQRNGYNVAKVEWLDDLSAEEEQRQYGHRTPSLPQLQTEVHRLVNDMLLPRLVNRFDLESQLGEMPSMADDAAKFAYWLCAVLPLRMDEKYAFLQLDGNWQRYSTLYAALKRLEQRDTA